MTQHGRYIGLALLALVHATAVGQTTQDLHDDHDDHGQHGHDHTHDHDHAHGDGHRHRPAGTGAHDHAGHAHPGVGLSHPIVIESPLPETKLRVNYSFADTGEGVEHVAELEGEYAFTQNFSIEAVVPYAFVNPEEGPSENGLADAILAFKFASYAWVDSNLLPAVGLEVILPTGDDESGIGSDHIVELEPFARLGYWNEKFEIIGSVGVGIPLNQTSEERDEEDFALAYGVSTLYHVAPSLQALIEVHGESVFGAEDVAALYVSPGVTFQPFDDKSINFGAGITLPITDDRDFDYAINLMSILHF
ncbi:MAG TPA: transporter [Tepidisphaeraceae bacterium]|jgi:hypothetical protein|nr:transporter [Tepidisphaeraceae bacterium]